MTVGDGCDGIFDSGGGIKITVTTVTYRHGKDGIGTNEECTDSLQFVLGFTPASLDDGGWL